MGCRPSFGPSRLTRLWLRRSRGVSVTKADYNKEIAESIGAMKESRATTPGPLGRLCDHHEKIILATALYVGNGLAEEIAHAVVDHVGRTSKDQRVVEFGRLKLRGYGMNDVLRAVIVAAVLGLVADRAVARWHAWKVDVRPVAGLVAGEGARP